MGAAQYREGWPEYDRYIELGAAAVANPDPVSRKEMLREMSQMFVDAVPWYGICDMMQGWRSTKTEGVEFWNSGGMRFVEWYWAE